MGSDQEEQRICYLLDQLSRGRDRAYISARIHEHLRKLTSLL
jgi:hypothetical protein